jgi:hypothetical protein
MDQDGVHFNADHPLRARQKKFGQSAFSGTDFDDQRCRIAAGRGGNGFENGLAGQEVLAKTAAQV